MPRLRRRFVIALIALPLVVAAGLLLAVEAGWFDGWLADRIVNELNARIQGRVTLAGARLRLLPPRVVVEDLTIAPAGDPNPEPAIRIASARIDLWTVDAVGTRRTLGRVAIDGLRLRIEETPGGRLNILNLRPSPEPDEQPRAPLLMRLAIGDLQLSNSVVIYHDQPIRLDSTGGGFDLDLRFDEPSTSYRGNLRLENFALRIGEVDLPAVSIRSPLHYSAEGLRLDPLQFESTGIEAGLSARIQPSDPAVYDVRVDRLQLDLPQIPALPTEAVTRGLIEVSGQAQGRGGDFSFQGNARSPRIVIRDEELNDFEASLSVDRQALTLVSSSWRYRGGRARAAGSLAFSDDARSSFRFSASGVNVPALLEARDWQFPLQTGRASADGRAGWPGLEFDRIRVAADATLSGQVGTSDNPLEITASSGVALSRQSIQLAGVAVAAEGVSLAGSGALDYSGGIDLDFEGQALSGDRLLAIANQSFEIRIPPPAQSIDFEEITRFSGRLQRVGDRLQLEGTLEPTRALIEGGPEGLIAASFNWAPGVVTVESFRLDGADFEAAGSLNWQYGPADVVDLEVTGKGLPLTAAAHIVQGAAVVDAGRLDGSLSARFEGDSRTASGRAEIEGLVVADRQLGQAEGSFALDDWRLELADVRTTGPLGTASGSLEIDLESLHVDGALELSNVELAALDLLPSGLGAAGQIHGRVQLQGRWPAVEGEIRLRSEAVSVSSQTITPFALTGRAGGGRLNFEVDGRFAEQSLQGSGSLQLGSPHRLEADIEMSNADLLALWALTGRPQPDGVAGSISARVRAEGPLSEPEAFDVVVDLEKLQLSHDSVRLELTQPQRLSWENSRLNMERFELANGSNRVAVSGFVDAAEPASLQLQIGGDLDLEILSAFLDQGRATGQLSIERLDVVGPVDNPKLVGRASLRARTLTHPDLPLPLADISADLRFTRDQLSIEEFQASTRHGSFIASGGVFLDGVTPQRWQINAFGYGLTLEYPEGLNSRIDFDVDFSRSERASLLSGVVYVRAAEYEEELSIADLVVMATQARSRAVGPRADDDLTVLDLDVEAYRTIRINNNLADVIASGDFRVRGTLANPVLLGDIVINEGRLRIENNDYEVARGTIRFDDPGATHPVLDLEVDTQVREYDVRLLLRGPVEQLRATVRSDPPLSTGEVVTLLATGEDPGEGSAVQRAGTLAAAGAGSLLSQTVGQQLSSKTRLFGFDRFSVDPFIDSGERDPGARITLGKQITNDLGVTYVTRLGGQLNRQAVIVQYRITDWLTGVGTGEQDGTIAIDFKIRKRF